ncbi:MAG: cobalt-precorrin-6A reductase [Rhodospirillales bacterium]|nr:cobalt-precorrin-6A reductase [Rhodospirillales bacterium]
MTRRLLILGGTTEAARLAERVITLFGEHVTVITSLAGRLPVRRKWPGRLRVGGFGGTEGLTAYLRTAAIDVVIDATHPFAERISRHAAESCAAIGVPWLRLVRPPWQPQPDDRWVDAGTLDEAAKMLPQIGRRAFLTTGPGSLDAFTSVHKAWFLVRLFEPPGKRLPLFDHHVVVARPPFTVDGERALIDRHRIDVLISKQSGGPTEAKLAAARLCGIPVIMIHRPPPPPGDQVDTVDAAIDWLHSQLQ